MRSRNRNRKYNTDLVVPVLLMIPVHQKARRKPGIFMLCIINTVDHYFPPSITICSVVISRERELDILFQILMSVLNY